MREEIILTTSLCGCGCKKAIHDLDARALQDIVKKAKKKTQKMKRAQT